VRSEDTGDGVRIVLRGDLDLASADEFERSLSGAQRKHPAAIAIDLTGLDFLDSRGLRAILTAQRLCEDAGCKLTLTAGEQARRLFELTGLSERLPLADLEAASEGRRA
jgi:anti-sigma B factor antagonist